ncbi:MAG: hypothetical protein V1772_02075, partial [Chloroflexota bacterium]
MVWWHLLLIAVEIYLLLTLASAIAAQVAQWRLLRGGAFLAAEQARLARLRELLERHAPLWPGEPRLGRYGEVDQRAGAHLAGLRAAAEQGAAHMAALAGYAPRALTWVEVIT